MGADCDDTDTEITIQCLCDGQKSPGCSCSQAGEQAACGTVYSRVGDTVVCGQGITSCDGEEWGECIINNAVTLSTSTDKAQSGLRALALGSAAACTTNPCDPSCQSFTDVPDSELPLTTSSGVVATTNGITLQNGEAIVLPGISGDGYSCNDAEYPAGGGCAHHICKAGSALSQYCDGDAPVPTPYTIFSEPFANNNQGWTLGTNWEIDEARSSSGHGTGNGDPSSDTTSGSNDGVAGTVLGGNIGGGTPIYPEPFNNLNGWTESGESNWRHQSAVTTSGWYGYTDISGNPVAHADNCNTGCTITSSVSVRSGSIVVAIRSPLHHGFRHLVGS